LRVVAAGVDEAREQRRTAAAGVQYRRAPVLGEARPRAALFRLGQRRVAVEDAALDELALHAAAPGPVEGLDAIALDVDAERAHEEAPDDDAHRNVGRAPLQLVRDDAVALLLESFGEAGVDEGAQEAHVAGAATSHSPRAIPSRARPS
jgi:hypothetical protein